MKKGKLAVALIVAGAVAMTGAILIRKYFSEKSLEYADIIGDKPVVQIYNYLTIGNADKYFEGEDERNCRMLYDCMNEFMRSEPEKITPNGDGTYSIQAKNGIRFTMIPEAGGEAVTLLYDDPTLACVSGRCFLFRAEAVEYDERYTSYLAGGVNLNEESCGCGCGCGGSEDEDTDCGCGCELCADKDDQ